MHKITVFPLALLLLFVSTALAGTIHVPNDYAAVQDAISAALDGDVVLVDSGTYLENIDFLGKKITVKSSQGPSVTIIDGGSPLNPDFGSVVTFGNGEDQDSVLEGFRITNGTGTLDPLSGSLRFGGGIYCQGASPMIMRNIIDEQQFILSRYGGGIYMAASSPMIQDNEISQCHAPFGEGGGIYAKGGSPQILFNEISHCGAESGGGIALIGSSALVEGNWVHHTGSENWGGGIYSTDSPPEIKNNRISGCGGVFTFGGGLACLGGGSIESNIIEGNYADTGGGLLSSGVHTGNLIRWNYAEYSGGGFWGHGVLINNIIYENMAIESSGGVDVSDATLTNNVIWGNEASKYYGGGVSCGASVMICNCIIRENTAPSDAEIFGSPSVRYSNVMGGWTGEGNIDLAPGFVDHENGDFHLQYTSPCRNAGDNQAPDLPEKDMEGDPRVSGGLVDMGADEFHTHLYFTGSATPGGAVDLKITDQPGAFPVHLWVGAGVLANPLSTPFGEWHLKFPIITDFDLTAMPVNGIMVLSIQIPPDYPAWDVPIQVLVMDRLTNLCVLEVE